MQIPETRNAYEFKAILDSRRGLRGPTTLPQKQKEPQPEAWSLRNLAKGLGQVSKWLDNAIQALTLNRETYAAIARDATMTGPALLILLLAQIVQTLNRTGQFAVFEILTRFGVWLLATLLLTFTARILRGQGDFTSTLRVTAFAQSGYVLELLSFLPIIGPLGRFLAVLLTTFGVWLGTAEAHKLKGWQTLLLPVVYVLATIVAMVFLLAAYEGLSLSLDLFMKTFGFVN